MKGFLWEKSSALNTFDLVGKVFFTISFSSTTGFTSGTGALLANSGSCTYSATFRFLVFNFDISDSDNLGRGASTLGATLETSPLGALTKRGSWTF